MVKPGKPRILAVIPGFITSTIMDVIKPLMLLREQDKIDFIVMLEQMPFLGFIRWADVVVFCRNTEPRYQEYLQRAIASGKRIIYDLDDNLFEIPLNSDLASYHRDPQRLQLLEHYIESADLVRVYSHRLAERIKSLSKSTCEMLPPVDWSLIRKPEYPNTESKKKIIYVTSRNDDTLFLIFAPALLKIMSEFSGKVEMYFWGYLPSEFKNLPEVHSIPFQTNYNVFLKQFSRMGFDIGLAPLLDDEFHRSKTNNKYREYGASGIAGIYSNVEVYSQWITHGKNGLLVDNQQQDWYWAMRELITNNELREKIARNAEKDVRLKYSHEKFVDDWLSQIHSILEKPGIQRKAAPTIEITSDRKNDLHLIPYMRMIFRKIKEKQFLNGKKIKLYLLSLWMMIKINIFNSL